MLSKYIVLKILINVYFLDMHNKFHDDTIICAIYNYAEFNFVLIYEHFCSKIYNYFLKIFCKNIFSLKVQNECIKKYFLEMFAEMQRFNKIVICMYKIIINNFKIWRKKNSIIAFVCDV